MPAELVKACLDVGLVTNDEAQAVRFYEGVLGFVHDMDQPFPGVGKVKRYNCGDSVFRIFVPDTPAAHHNTTGGLAAQTGLRYITLTVRNLDDLVAQIRSIGIDVAVEETGTRRDLDPSVDLAAYRVIQEALTNVNKHAGAGAVARVELSVHRQDHGPDHRQRRLELPPDCH